MEFAVRDFRHDAPGLASEDLPAPLGTGPWQGKLGVDPQEVVLRLTESADGFVGLQASMWPMPVVAMEPVVQLGGSLI